MAGLVDCLDLAGIPAFAEERAAQRPSGKTPLVVIGGPLTFSNPIPAAPYADVMLLGECEETLPELIDALRDEPDRAALLAGLAARPGFYVPSIHGARLPADRRREGRQPARVLAASARRTPSCATCS